MYTNTTSTLEHTARGLRASLVALGITNVVVIMSLIGTVAGVLLALYVARTARQRYLGLLGPLGRFRVAHMEMGMWDDDLPASAPPDTKTRKNRRKARGLAARVLADRARLYFENPSDTKANRGAILKWCHRTFESEGQYKDLRHRDRRDIANTVVELALTPTREEMNTRGWGSSWAVWIRRTHEPSE